MKTICLLLLFALLALVYAAPAPAPTPDNEPTVNVLRYRNDQELEQIQRSIIAQYEAQLGGSTQVHAPRTATLVNPQTLGIHI
ncbi:uncharacterized protein [Drosophila virilis]|uniref:uncharacterized protein n=1 Tax=Drosophila virilis TaxID=7244 RepID=UPI00017D5B58|nr:uncharacterized protein LOC116651863 [Drosophila virilis]